MADCVFTTEWLQVVSTSRPTEKSSTITCSNGQTYGFTDDWYPLPVDCETIKIMFDHNSEPVYWKSKGF